MRLAVALVLGGGLLLLGGLGLGVALFWGALAAVSVAGMVAGGALIATGLLGDFDKARRRR